jgi:inosose dehydratase
MNLLNRRAFIRRTSLAVGGAAALVPISLSCAAPSGVASKTLVGSNIYGWTQYAQREGKTLDVPGVISSLRDCGYDYLETFMDVGKPEANATFAEQLKAKGLQPVSLYTGGTMHEAPKAAETVARILAAAKVCKAAGFVALSCNPDPIGRAKTETELKTQVGALADLGQGLNELGIRLGIHHHLPEMANNAREFHFVFNNTKPEIVGFCYDVHWVWKGGISPLAALKDYGERIVTWHLRQSRAGVWWEDLDSGDVDYAAVAAYAREHHLARRLVVELALEGGTKVTRSAVENHRRSREFVRKVFESMV